MSEENHDEVVYSQQYQILSSAPRILSILRPVQEKHSLVSVSFKKSTRLFNTVFLAVDADNNTITIDELHPNDGNEILRDTRRLLAHTMLDGVDVNFETDLISAEQKDGVDYFVLRLPEKIRYKQRRQAYRVSAVNVEKIPVSLTVDNKTSHAGILYDISLGGICVLFDAKNDPTDALGKDQILCKISVDDNSQIECLLKIRHSHLYRHTDQMHVGCKFMQLDKTQHRIIERLVATLQRKSRKAKQRS